MSVTCCAASAPRCWDSPPIVWRGAGRAAQCIPLGARIRSLPDTGDRQVYLHHGLLGAIVSLRRLFASGQALGYYARSFS